DALVVVMTQSGETADTIVGMHQARERGALTVAVTNVVASTAARDADGAIYLHAGPEIGVASTKTFVAHLVSQYLLALRIATIHAEGSSGGELKHGPIALVDAEFPVIAVCTESPTREKMISNVHEVVARDAPVLAVVTEGDHALDDLVSDLLVLPKADEASSAVLTTVALQLFAYHVAVQ